MTEAALQALLPQHKSDLERARAIAALGYPAVAPVLRELLTWIQDGNWPVSHLVSKFLASVGAPVVPLIREVFEGDDNIWKYWCINDIVMYLSREIAEQLRPNLQRLAFHPSAAELTEEVNERASIALEWLNGRG